MDKVMLVVDDLEMNRSILRVTFEDEFRVLAASSGEEALKILKKEKVDVLITDIFMEKMDGYSLIRHIREDKKIEHLPIIAVTEHDEVMQEKAIEAGADDFISKPFASDILKYRVRGVLYGDALEARIAQYHYCFDHNPMAFAILKLLKDEAGKYTSCSFIYTNKALADLAGKPEGYLEQFHFLRRYTQKYMPFLAQVNEDDREHKQSFYEEVLNIYIEITAYREKPGYISCIISDVTENHRLEKISSMIKYLNYDDTSGIIMAEANEDLTIQYMNKTAIHFFGLKNMEEFRKVMGTSLRKLVHPQDWKQFQDHLARGQQKESIYQVIARMENRDHEYFWLEQSGKYTKDELGRDVFICSCLDVSQRVQERVRLEQMIQSIPVGISVYQIGGGHATWVSSNHALHQLRGMNDEELKEECIGNWKAKHHPQDVESLEKLASYILHGENTDDASREMVIRTYNKKTRELVWVLLKCTRTQQEDGSIFCYLTYNDLTNQRKSKENFLESEQSLQAAVRHSSLEYWEYDSKTHRVEVGQKARDLYQLPKVMENFPESYLNLDIVHPRDKDTYRDMIGEIDNGSSYEEREIRVREFGSQAYTWKKICYSVIYDEELQPVKLVATGQNIDAYKNMERLYKEEVEYRKNIYQKLVCSCRLNLSKNRLEECIQGEIAPQVEISPDETDYLTRMSHFLDEITLNREENKSLSPEFLLEQYREGITVVQKHYMAFAKGTNDYIWVEVDVRLVERPETGEIIAFFYNKDNSDYYIYTKITETILKFDYDLAGIIIVPNRHIHLISQADHTSLPDMNETDYDKERIDFYQKYAVHPELDHIIEMTKLDTILEKLKYHKTYSVEIDIREPDHTIRHKQMRFNYVSKKDGIIAMTRWDIEDVLEEEKKKQKLLKKALKDAEKANLAKTDFLASMSHEIRTPMNVIVGLTNLATQMEMPSDTLGEYLENIRVSSQHLLNLINDVLDMSKMGSGEFSLNNEVYDLRELLHNIHSIVYPLCQQKQITLTEEITGEHPPILVDRVRLNQICYNLLTNAVKYTPAGGSVSFKCHGIRQEDKLNLVFSFQDNGVGMSKDFQRKMFEPFTQEQQNLNSVQGTGLGLAITKTIIDKMGGTIEVESKKGEGSTFRVNLLLEVAGEETVRTHEKERDDRALAGKKFLMVDDHPVNRMIVTRLLAAKKAEVVTAEDGQKAVEAFWNSAQGEFTAILMDVRMPVMDGLTATRKIRKLDRADASEIPIIAMTANAYDEDRRRSREAGMNEHLAKPVEADTLYRCLLRYC